MKIWVCLFCQNQTDFAVSLRHKTSYLHHLLFRKIFFKFLPFLGQPGGGCFFFSLVQTKVLCYFTSNTNLLAVSFVVLHKPYKNNRDIGFFFSFRFIISSKVNTMEYETGEPNSSCRKVYLHSLHTNALGKRMKPSISS